MVFRLGYVAMTLNLESCTPSGTVTYTNYQKLDGAAQKVRLARISKSNLENTLRILKYNRALDIEIYRLTSKLIPLATHSALEGWDYCSEFSEQFKQLGDFIKENDFRISAHPDHFTLLNPEKENVLVESIKDLNYHINMYEAMGLDSYKYKLVIHVGGLYGDKQKSIERFKTNYRQLPQRIQKRLMLENDDKSYTANDVLDICKELSIPMVIDIHHHKCVNNGESLGEILPKIFDTWNKEAFPPKIHFSSPKNEKDFRSHADYIDYGDFIEFLNIAKEVNQDFDIMLEAKMKDNALLKLSEQLSKTKGITMINKATFRI